MRIHWYPGHMVTARKDAAEAMRTTDLVIEVLDARAPHASCNPAIEALRKQSRRPALKLLNKADLADAQSTPKWLAYYNALPDVTAIAVSAKSAGDVGRILKAARAMVPDRGTPARPLRMMILGVPNAGKSTLMNAILKRRVAAVGDQPAVTKMHMGHAVGKDMWLIDTPGLLWPGMEHQGALRLAALHSIGANGYDDQEVAVELGHHLLRHYPALVADRFGAVAPGSDGNDVLALVARTRSLVMKGGAPDVNKAAVVLLNDFRSGAIGRITLESPDGAPAGAA